MRACEKCFENNWKYKTIEDIIRATCNLCGHEVEFASRKKAGKAKQETELKEGSPCRKCGAKIILKEPKKHKTNTAYYFSAYYFCPKCKTMYMAEKFKVWNEAGEEKTKTTKGNQGGILDMIKATSEARPIALEDDNAPKQTFYCDAGTQNNGQFGNQKTVVVVTDVTGKVLVEEHIGDKTNNEGELIGILKATSLAPSHSVILSDSQLAVNWAKGRYKTRIDRLKPLVTEVKNAVKEKGVEVKWIPREENQAGIYIENTHSL